MADTNLKRLYIAYKYITAVLVTVSLVTLGLLCIKIYLNGEKAFTREIVTVYLCKWSPILYITAAVVFGGFVFALFSPASQRGKAELRYDFVLDSYKNKYLPTDSSIRENKKRRTILCVFYLLACVAALLPVIYFSDKNNFTVESLNTDVIAASVAVFIPAVFVFVFAIIFSCIAKKSVIREIECYKDAVKSGNAVLKPKGDNVKTDRKKVLRLVLAVAAVLLIILGVFNDGIGDVYGKAVRICTECIGLG